ncbi:MAG TPA: lytic murein transglycosylase, partial [Beijerinckiaceae bacterium]|nr:lytic murein transglycosylase [Beijerinckiaceae bacterium]
MRLALTVALAALLAGPAAAQSDFRSCLAGLRGQAAAEGISAAAFDRAFSGVQPDMSVLELMDNQPEFKTPIWDYMAALVTGPAAAQSDFRACLASLRGEAVARGISAETFDAATRGLTPDMSVLELMDNQPEFKTPIWDYIAALVDEERVTDGRAAMRQHGQALATAESRYSVDRHIIAGVWGVESNFGKDIGGRPLVQSLTTIACHGSRRRDYFKGELFATLKIIDNGDIQASRLRGSWAGAFGHTQFMPSTFQRLAVDLDGDGRRDVVDSVPDALGSTANVLKKAGWVTGLPWGYEVRLPSGY